MSHPSIKIRDARMGDAEGIARVHVDTWRTTYKGIVPDDHLAKLSVEKRVAAWGRNIGEMPEREHIVVAEDPDGRIVGFSNAGPNRDDGYPYDGEIFAIYLLKAYQGSGVGRRLFQASIDRLIKDRFQGMLIWALEENPTCGFYKHFGGRIVGEKSDEIGGKQLKELAFGWESLMKNP